MTADDSLDAWLRLTLLPGVGGESQRQLLNHFGLPAAIFSADRQALRTVVGESAADLVLGHDCHIQVAAALAWAQQASNHILTLADADYPQALLASADPPVVLYAKGNVAQLNQPAFAIVGSRNATTQGEANARAFAGVLAGAGFAVVSGLALGIDAAAHRGALEAGGGTVAVIGTGLDRIYPARNAALARDIAARGVIVSEFALGTPPLAHHFPRRNRIIAGLARGCLVVEAAEQSGSLITARLAADIGCEVFAIPGSIHAPLSKGCHRLIKQGAKLVECAEDILEELRWEAVVAPLVGGGAQPNLAAPAKAGRRRSTKAPAAVPDDDPILVALGHDPCDLDTLAARTGLGVDSLLVQLLPLELDGRIAALPGGRFQRLG